MRAKLSEIKKKLRRRMHQAIPAQGRWLVQVIRGYFANHAVPTNVPALSAFCYHIRRLWLRTLRRRRDRGWNGTTVRLERRVVVQERTSSAALSAVQRARSHAATDLRS